MQGLLGHSTNFLKIRSDSILSCSKLLRHDKSVVFISFNHIWELEKEMQPNSRSACQ